MIDAAKIAAKSYVDAFASIYPIDPVFGMTLSISSFVSCYSMMPEDDRLRTCAILFEIIGDIGSERFEDGKDFVEFMKQKLTEKRESL